VLLIMREEFVGHLSEYEKECPSIFQHRFRLEKMGRADVRAVISKTLQVHHYRSDFTVSDPGILASLIVAKLPDNQQEIELTHVQVFLNELWERAKETKITKSRLIDKNLIDDDDKLEKILDSFLKKQILNLEKNYQKSLPLEVLVAMISERGTKLQLSEDEIKADLRKKQIDTSFPLLQLLTDFKKKRVIRSIRSGNKIKYEISHDVLAELIKKNKTQAMIMRDEANTVYSVYRRRKDRLLNQSDIDYLRPYRKHMEYPINLKWRIEESLAHINKQEELALKIAKRRVRLLITVPIFLLSTIFIFIYLWNKITDKKKENEKIEVDITSKSKVLCEVIEESHQIFDEDELKLHRKNSKYGFVDRDGNVIIDYEYDEATEFDYADYAKVKIRSDRNSLLHRSYLLNRTGKKYRVEYSIFDAKSFQNTYDDEIFTALDLRGRGWNKTPDDIFTYRQLEVLLLGSNSESTYPNENQIEEIPTKIKNLKSLKILDLKGNSFRNLPKEIGELTKLEYLDLSYTKLDSLPVEIGQLTNLQNLDLSANELTSLPVEIGQLKNLQSLNLNYGKLTSLPKEIGRLKNLQSLYLGDNNLTSLPVEIEQLKNLQSLDLRYNNFSQEEKQKIKELLPNCKIKF